MMDAIAKLAIWPSDLTVWGVLGFDVPVTKKADFKIPIFKRMGWLVEVFGSRNELHKRSREGGHTLLWPMLRSASYDWRYKIENTSMRVTNAIEYKTVDRGDGNLGGEQVSDLSLSKGRKGVVWMDMGHT